MTTGVKKKREAVNLSLKSAERDDLQDLARANRMTVTQLVRLLGAKALDNPTGFGLLPPKEIALVGVHHTHAEMQTHN